MGIKAKLKQRSEEHREAMEKIFVNGKMVNKLNFNPIEETYKNGKHEKWFKRNILCVYADGTKVNRLKDEIGAYCFMALYNGELVFSEFCTSDNIDAIKLDSVGFEELAVIKALEMVVSHGYKDIIFFHDCMAIQDDAKKRKYKKDQEFPLQWELFDVVNSFDGNICFQKLTSNDNPYHNLVDRTLRASRSYLDEVADGKGEAKKGRMMEFLKKELEELLEIHQVK